MDERTKKLIDTYNTSGPLSTGQIGDVIATTPSTITSASLSNPEPAIQIPQPKSSTLGAGISGATTALLEMDKLQQEARQKREENELKLKEIESNQQTYLNKIGFAKKDITTKGRKEFDLDTLEPTRRKSLQDLKTSQVRELAEIKALDSLPLTLGEKSQRTGDIQRRYGMEQLEAQLSYHLANDDITAAEKTIADRITLETEPLYAQLDLTEKVYDQIKDSLTVSEKNLWDLKIAEVTQSIDQKNKIAEFAKTVAANGAPADVINRVVNSGNMADAIQNGGQYAGDVLERQIKQAQLDKLNIEIGNLSRETTQVTPVDAYQQERNTRVINQVNDLMKRATFQTVGFASVGSFMPASLPRNFRADLDNLKANIAFGELQAMRAASKTGGALGQVSERELALLESAMAGLDQGQSPSNFKKNLQSIKDSLDRWYGAASQVSEDDQLRAAGYTEEQIQQIKNAQ